MGKINRFMEPQDRNVTDTYVSQYVPLPFKAMKARTMEMDKGAREERKAQSDLTNSIDVDVNEVDRPYLNEYHKQISERVNSLQESSNGDYYAMSGQANIIGQDVERELNYGLTKFIGIPKILANQIINRLFCLFKKIRN